VIADTQAPKVPKELQPSRFTPAKSRREAMSRLNAMTAKGYGAVLNDVHLNDLNSILQGLEDTVGCHGVKLNRIGFTGLNERALGVFSPGRNAVEIDYKMSTMPVSRVKERHNEFTQRRLKALIRSGKNSIELSRKSFLAKTRRDLVLDSRDPLRSVALHEGFHGVFYHKGLERKWKAELMKQGIKQEDWYTVSMYAGIKRDSAEFFAETGSAIYSNISVNPKIKSAFIATMRGVK
jgi:hypothetical protein